MSPRSSRIDDSGSGDLFSLLLLLLVIGLPMGAMIIMFIAADEDPSLHVSGTVTSVEEQRNYTILTLDGDEEVTYACPLQETPSCTEVTPGDAVDMEVRAFKLLTKNYVAALTIT